MKGATVSDENEELGTDIGDEDRLDDGGDLTDLPDLYWTGDEPTLAPTTEPAEGGPRRRLGGLLALALGLLGVVLALVLGFLALRLLFGASGRVDDAMEPIGVAFDRLEERIDQADDLIDRRGIDTDQVEVLQARVDGLVDVSTAAQQSFDSVEDHPIYGLLPADLSGLGDHLADFGASASAIEESLGSSPTVRPAVAASMADEIDGMQSRVTGARETIDDAASSLRSWLRIAGLVGFLIALWMLWSQVVFLRRGWRGFRNREV